MPSSMPSSAPHPVRRPVPRPKPPNAAVAEAEAQWIFSEDELLRTPSIIDGWSPEQEKEARKKGSNFILQVGMMLKLPQMTLATACVYFNRYLMRRTLVHKDGVKPLHHYVSNVTGLIGEHWTYDVQQVAATSLFLATKVEENCRKMKELIIACVRVATKSPNQLVDEQTKDFWKWRDTILYFEDVLLETICFDLSLESPYQLLYTMLRYLGVHHNKPLRDAAWCFLNDTVTTPICLLFNSRTIAAAALYGGARQEGIAFPDEDGKPWWEIQYVKLKDITRAWNHLVDNYEHVPNKDGSNSIYVGRRFSEDEDPLHAATRLRTSQTPMSPAASSVGMERSASELSLKRNFPEAVYMDRSASEQSLKRKREDGSENGVTNGTSSHAQPKEENSQNGATNPTQVQQDSKPKPEAAQNGEATKIDPSSDERDSKRPKVETNGVPKTDTTKPVVAAAEPVKEDDDVSEEGEVEE